MDGNTWEEREKEHDRGTDGLKTHTHTVAAAQPATIQFAQGKTTHSYNEKADDCSSPSRVPLCSSLLSCVVRI